MDKKDKEFYLACFNCDDMCGECKVREKYGKDCDDVPEDIVQKYLMTGKVE